jgi:hypothetical protein
MVPSGLPKKELAHSNNSGMRKSNMVEKAEKCQTLRARIERESLPAKALLKTAQPFLTKNGQTAGEWEVVELLLARALQKLNIEGSAQFNSMARKILSSVVPVPGKLAPQLRDSLLFEVRRLQYRLNYVTDFEQLVMDLLPKKRELHAQFAAGRDDLNLLTQALKLTLGLRRRFSSMLKTLLWRIRIAIQALNVDASPLIKDIKLFCDNPGAQFNGDYEENLGRFKRLFNLHKLLEEVACSQGLERLFQPMLAEQLEAELAERVEQYSLRIALQEQPEIESSVKLFKQKQGSFAINLQEIALLSPLIDIAVGVRRDVVLDLLYRGLALISALEERSAGDWTIDCDYLRSQLLVTIQHLEWLASYPCITHNDIELAGSLGRTHKRWRCYLGSPQAQIALLSA